MNAQPQYITNANGEKMSVILLPADYQELSANLAALVEHKYD